MEEANGSDEEGVDGQIRWRGRPNLVEEVADAVEAATDGGSTMGWEGKMK